ncbi:hypothetical protein HETIRDRAFT_422837 [Heterobasidion irregulare TC 32-1]|uniref:Uncharacterized protein n=1 Tax=Heterobasidion irregulare (strain TC 32-1) TaxID=747525 RepID=W4JNG9_HETIT|nr:uncharacterized protein HETIRDRAFT_422837 [Heterobasidion irregulare TC 32-1]ETW75088.1 hypothetical protein HETIRDRAFT_422837 [Heterobasidion irregulare TC 32-1]
MASRSTSTCVLARLDDADNHDNEEEDEEEHRRGKETVDEDIYKGTSSLAPVPPPYAYTSRLLPDSPCRLQQSTPRLYPPPPLVRSTSPTSDPLSRPTRSPVRPSRPHRSLYCPPRSPRTISCPLAHRPARPHRPHRLAHRMRCPDPRSTDPHLPLDAALACSLQLETTAVHHPDTSSASSTFPLPPPPPLLSPPPPPTPPPPPLPPADAAPLSCGAPCPAPAAETAPCRTTPSPYPP